AVVYDDLLWLEAGCRCGLPDGPHRGLGTEPDFELVALQVHSGVERLHGGMSEVRRFIDRLDDLSALAERVIDVAVVARIHHWSTKSIAIELGELRTVSVAFIADVPFGLEQREGFLGSPEAIGDNRYCIVELDHLQDAAAAFRRRVVYALKLAAE